jgi:hypothetical protein
MTTPPTDPEQSQPNLTPDPTLNLFLLQRKEINLAKFATIFAITFGIAFGLCTVGEVSGFNQSPYIFITSAVIEVICLIGLLATAVIAIVRGIRNQFRHD